MTGQLDSNSTLVWKSNGLRGLSAEVKTASTQAALGTTSSREIGVSGGILGAASTDNWMAITFNFARKILVAGGIFEDNWSTNGSGRVRVPYVSVDTPVLYEYKVTKDKDLLNLQADGLSVFRVSSSGDVFTATGGTINTSGADLAERYTSQEPLDFGDVVTIDSFNSHAVKKSKYQYQTDMVGVVSTDPGFIAGAYTENSYPIGLIGRVPVKVSTENGTIRVGDYLTTSSVPGHAMKATLSGRVLGKALESVDPSKLVDCPASDMYIAGRKCTKIMMFVNLIDFGGQSVDTAMTDWKMLKDARLSQLALDNGLEYVSIADNRLATSSRVSSMSSGDAEVLEFLTQLKAEREDGVTSSSELFTDKISAITRIISPEIIAKIVKSETIDGLVVNADRINTKAITTDTISNASGITMSLVDGKLVIRGRRLATNTIASTTNVFASSTDNLANALSALTNATSTEEIVSSTEEFGSTTESIATTTDENATTTIAVVAEPEYVEDEITVSFDTSGNAYFAGEVVANKVSTGGLAVTGVATFTGGLEVTSIGNASTTLAMLSDVEFFGRPYFTTDTGGVAMIKGGAKTVDVVFDREYVEAPIISASIAYATTTSEEEIELMFEKDVRFIVTKRDAKGFTIRINKNITEDVVFNWIALAVKDSKVFTSRTSDITPIAEDNVATTTPVVTGGDGTGTTTPITTGDNGTTTPITTGDTGTTTPVTTDPVVVTPEPELVPEPIVSNPVVENIAPESNNSGAGNAPMVTEPTI